MGASSVIFRMAEARLYKASATEGVFTTEQLRTLVTVSVRSAGVGVEIAWMFMCAGSLLSLLAVLAIALFDARWLASASSGLAWWSSWPPRYS